jgi:glycosyltransferase involved in cell wall biosynthesis
MLFSNPEFDFELIEVIVCDNCSTDDTAVVVAKYPHIKYYRNSENIRDSNFAVALGHSTGCYLKLFNDTLSFKSGALKFILDCIKNKLELKENLFFYNNMFLNKNCQKEANSVNEYIKQVSFQTTWIANFGVWCEDFQRITNKEKYVQYQFTQVDWTYQIAANGKKTNIYFDEFYDVVPTKQKGSYNVFDTFINKYLFVVKSVKLPLLVYELEKYRLCRYFVYPWLVMLFITEKNTYSFDIKGAFKIIFLKYWYEPYLYVILFKFWIIKMRNEKDNK